MIWKLVKIKKTNGSFDFSLGTMIELKGNKSGNLHELGKGQKSGDLRLVGIIILL